MASFRLLSKYKFLKNIRHVSSSASQAAGAMPAIASKESAESLYPPIIPEYPPGRWGGIHRDSAWMLHDIGERMLKIPTVKLRLEFMAGDAETKLWAIEPLDKRPRNLEFRKFITRTHVVNGLPDLYKNINAETTFNLVKSDLGEIIEQELWLTNKAKLEPDLNGVVSVDEEKYVTQRVFSAVLRYLKTHLSKSTKHILNSQIDENVKVESFWYNSGVKDECEGKLEDINNVEGDNAGMIVYQYKHKTCWQLRTQLPLPPVVPLSDPLCHSQYLPVVDYTPAAASLTTINSKPFSVSGHWTGAPCEWTSLSLHTVSSTELRELRELGEGYVNEAMLGFGLTAGFGSCLAQAHNQGFCYLFDLTYPITTQCIVTDGKHMRVFTYQLNTLQLWKEYGDNGNPKCNLLWASDPMPLFEAEGSKIKTLNQDTFQLLIKCLLMEPQVEKGLNLRPYFGQNSSFDEPTPLEINKYINIKGEDVIKREKIGRFQYPINSPYFSSSV